MDLVAVRGKLKRHEGSGPVKNGRFQMYKDSVGVWTIGYGRNLAVGLRPVEVDGMLDNDILDVAAQLAKALPWWDALNDARQDVLVNMGFNLGVPGLLKFKRMLQYINERRWSLAAEAMLDSKWADQVGARAVELAQIMRTGVDSE